MLTADALLKATQDLMRQNQKTASELSATMEKIRLSERNVSQTVAGAEQMGKSIAGVRDKAVEAKGAMDLRLGGTAQVVADAAIQERALNKVRDAAVEARIAEAMVGQQGTGALRPFAAEGGFGQFYPGSAQAEPYLPPKRGFYQPPQRGFYGGAASSIIGPTGGIQYEEPLGPPTEAESPIVQAAAAAKQRVREYEALRSAMVDEQRVSGAIPMPAAPSVVGGDDVYRQYRQNLLDSQRSGNGALVMGPADVQKTWGQLFEEKIRGAQAETANTRRARAYLEGKGVSDLGRGFEDLTGFGLLGSPEDAFGGGGGRGGGDGRRGFLGFGDGRPGNLTRNLISALPGGRRPGTLVVSGLAGLGIAAAPALGPAALGGAFGAGTMGLGSLAGTIGTLQLAFADLSKQAFTNRQAFDKLTPVQQQFVQTLRSLDAGLGKSLEGIAQQGLLPRIDSALHSMFTPALTGALGAGVGAFATNIGQGAQQVGNMFGSQQFASALGPVMQADARYTQDFIVELGKLADAWVHVSQAAIPFTDWIDKGILGLTTWTDKSLKAAQASGQLAHFFDQAKTALQALGGLGASLGRATYAIADLFGFQNAISTINLLTGLLNGIGATLNANRDLFRTAFSGLLQGVQDVTAAVGFLMQGIQPLADQLKNISDGFRDFTQALGLGRNGLNLFRVAVDALVATIGIKLLVSMVNAQREIAVTGTVAATTATSVNTLGIAAATGAANAGRLSGALLALRSIGVIVLTLDILTNFLPQGNIPNPLKNFPIAGSVYGFGQLLGGGRGEDLSNVPVETDAFKFWNNKGTKISSSNPLFWTDIEAGRINAQQVQALRSHFVSKDQYKAALTFATQTAQAAAAGGTGVTPSSIANAAAVGAAGIPTPDAFAPPTPFSGAKGNILPQNLLTAISAADYTQNVQKEVAARQAAISWIDAHRGSYKGVDLQNLLGEGASLKQQITTLTGANASVSGTGFLSEKMQNALAGAQQAVASAGIQGTSAKALAAAGPDAVKQQMDSLRQLVSVEAEAYQQLLHMTVPMKEHKALLAEQVSLSKELGRNLKELNALSAGEKALLHQTQVQSHIDRILGTGNQVPGIQSLRTRERNVLLGTLERELKPAHGRGALASYLPAGAADASIPSLIKMINEHGPDIPKSTLNSLKKINEVLELARKEHVHLSTTQTQNIVARLAEINNTLKSMKAYPSNYRIPTESKLLEMAGLGNLTGEARRKAGEKLVQVAEHFGKVPTGPAALGIPLTHSGATLPTSHVTINGDVKIHISGAEKDPKIIAAEVRNELLKGARRNPTQTRGPNAGRNRGLN